MVRHSRMWTVTKPDNTDLHGHGIRSAGPEHRQCISATAHWESNTAIHRQMRSVLTQLNHTTITALRENTLERSAHYAIDRLSYTLLSHLNQASYDIHACTRIHHLTAHPRTYKEKYATSTAASSWGPQCTP
jgi:hypothetical protein